jgi:hypothetical protein
MRYSIYKILIFVIIGELIISASLSLELAVIYSTFLLMSIIFKRLNSRLSLIADRTFDIMLLSIIFSYFLRPLILYYHPEFYYYSKTTSALSKDVLINEMFIILINTFFLYLGFTISNSLMNLRRKNGILKDKITINWNLNKDKFLINNFKAIAILLSTLVFIRVFLNVFLEVGVKGRAINSSWAFLSRFAPEDLIISIIIVYFIFYKTYLTRGQKVVLWLNLFFITVALLATGSKASALLIGVSVLTYYLIVERKFKAIRVAAISLVLLILIPFSFNLGDQIKYSIYSGDKSIVNIFSKSLDNFLTKSPVQSYNQVTSRFIGVDGSIAKSKLGNSQQLYVIFGIEETLYRSLDMILPFGSFKNTVNSGKAVSLYIQNMPDDVQNAGAIGGYASLDLMFGNIPFVGIFLFGLAQGLIIKLISRIKNLSFLYLIFFSYTFFVINAIMSGNYDFIIAIFLIKIILFFVYYKFIKGLKSIKYA